MKKMILLAGSLLLLASANAQTFAWAKSLGSGSNEEGHGIAVDASGNVYSAGTFTGSADFDPGSGTFTLTSPGSTEAYISKLDASGNFVWAIRMGGTGPQSAVALALDNAGNIYITGNFNNTIDLDPGPGVVGFTSLGAQDIFVAKYDPSGNHVWSKRFGSIYHEAASAITVDGSGNVITCGLFTGTTDFDPGAGTVNLTALTTSDGYISKLNANGDYVWAKSIGLGGSNTVSAVTYDPAGNLYLTGHYEGTVDFDPGAGSYPITAAGMVDVFTLKLLSNGDFSWAGSIGGTTGDYGRSIAIDANGDVLLTGEFQGTADLDPTVGVYNQTSAGVKDVFVAKYHPATASFVWAVRFGDVYNDIGYSITTDAANNCYLSGNFTGTVDFDPGAGSVALSSAGNQRDCFILKLDPSGNYLWAGVFGSSFEADDCFAIYVDAATSIYTTGYYRETVDFDPGSGTANVSSGGQADAFVHKMQQCSSPAAPVNTTPLAALTICGSGSTTLTATGAGTLSWYAAPSGGTSLGGGTSYATPVLNATTTYYVQDSTCMAGPRTAVTVTSNPAMSSSLAAQTNISCNGSANGAATISASGGTGAYSYTWVPSGGTAATASGLSANTYTCTVTDANQCTTSQTVTITEPAVIATAQTITLCSGQTFTVGANTYSVSGTYTDVLLSASGCDSTVTTTLTISAPMDLTLTPTATRISVNQNGASYQWIDCANGNAPIVGAWNQTFIPATSGTYAVIVTIGSCSDTSACTAFVTGVNDNRAAVLSVYPNPTSGRFMVELASAATVSVTDATGREVWAQPLTAGTTLVDLSNQAQGLYLLKVVSHGAQTVQRLVIQP